MSHTIKGKLKFRNTEALKKALERLGVPFITGAFRAPGIGGEVIKKGLKLKDKNGNIVIVNLESGNYYYDRDYRNSVENFMREIQNTYIDILIDEQIQRLEQQYGVGKVKKREEVIDGERHIEIYIEE